MIMLIEDMNCETELLLLHSEFELGDYRLDYERKVK
jgi:hypothetical protein